MNAATAYFKAFIDGELDSFATHAVLIGVIALAEISLGIGIWLESPKEKGLREWLGLYTVLGGCVVSVIATVFLLIFDEGISRTQKARIDEQQSTIISLQKSNAFLLAEGQELAALASRARREAVKATERAAQLEKEVAAARVEIANANTHLAEAQQRASYRRILVTSEVRRQRLELAI
jgi:hypothetical protein